MKRQLKLSVVMFVSSTLLSGCFGYDRVLFVTKTNMGIDVENQPPTAEITVARRELAIAPAFRDSTEKDNTPPLLASFGRKGSVFSPGITSIFAGGTAAVWLGAEKDKNEEEGGKTENTTTTGTEGGADPEARPMGTAITAGAIDKINTPTVKNEGPDADQGPSNKDKGDEFDQDSALCLSKKPDPRPPIKKLWHWIFGEPEEITESTRAFYFATDTSIGLKVGWDGTGGPYPTNLKFGYNRKESALPPVLIKEGCAQNKDLPEQLKDNNTSQDGDETPKHYEVKVPSFFASLDHASNLTTLTDSKVKHVQFFATGKAATEFVKRESIRREVFERMAPKAADAEASQLELNQDLIEEIEEAFNEPDGTKQDEIMAKAKSLKLIDMNDNGPNNDHFIEELKKHSNSSDPQVSTNLNKVRRVALAQPDVLAELAELPTLEEPPLLTQ